ncbi:MAG: hypothetical protein QME81_07360 [bacterium]|nr:hypothetical protein [bacterium]
MRKGNKLILIFGLLILLVGGVILRAGLEQKDISFSEANEVKTVPVICGFIESEISVSGEIGTLELRTLTSEVKGMIKSLSLKEGDTVTIGATLCVISAPELKEEILRVENELEIKKRELKKIEKWPPEDELLKAQQGLEMAKLDLDLAQKGLIKAESEYKRDYRHPYVEVEALINHTEGVRPRLGSQVEVEVIIDRKERALVVPQEAVLKREEGRCVYVVKDGRATLRPVKVGLIGKKTVEIKRGLQEGEKVVAAGHLEIKDGAKVKAVTSLNKDKRKGILW